MPYEMRDTGSLNYTSTVYNDFHMTNVEKRRGARGHSRKMNNSISSLDYVTKESREICTRRSSVQFASKNPSCSVVRI